MGNIRWGIIGTGRIANTFAAALSGTQGSELYAAASRHLEKADIFAKKYNISKAYGSYRELAENGEIDAVYIATPMASHFEDALMCLRSGRNVLCEKSVTLNAGQLKILLDTAAENDLFFMEAMWTKCRPAYLKVREWIKTGKIGDIRYIKADFSNLCKYDPNDRLFRPDCGGGALLDLAVYPLTLAEDILGMPDEVISSSHLRGGIDLSDTILLKWKNGACASIDAGFEIPLRNNAMISGEKGFIIFGDWFFCTSEAVLYDREGNIIEEYKMPNLVNGYEYEIMEVQRCLSEGKKESRLVPHSGTMNVMKIMDECRRQWGLEFPGEKE